MFFISDIVQNLAACMVTKTQICLNWKNGNKKIIYNKEKSEIIRVTTWVEQGLPLYPCPVFVSELGFLK